MENVLRPVAEPLQDKEQEEKRAKEGGGFDGYCEKLT
jgi:hypothetical protein